MKKGHVFHLKTAIAKSILPCLRYERRKKDKKSFLQDFLAAKPCLHKFDFMYIYPGQNGKPIVLGPCLVLKSVFSGYLAKTEKCAGLGYYIMYICTIFESVISSLVISLKVTGKMARSSIGKVGCFTDRNSVGAKAEI